MAKATDGRESVISVLGPGALFGEMSMFDGGVRSAHARALTTVHLIAVDFDDVREVLAHRPDVLWAVVRILARRLRATDEALADAMFLDVTGRTAKRLLALADGEDDFRMPLTQEELAGMVGASRERVNKAIALFVKLGWLEISGRSQYRIVDRAELEARADQLTPRRSSAERSRRSRVSQHAAASSARCTGRSGSCTKPCSAPSTTTISQSVRPLHAARSASMSAAGVHGSTDPKIASVGTSRRPRRAARCGARARCQPSGVRSIP